MFDKFLFMVWDNVSHVDPWVWFIPLTHDRVFPIKQQTKNNSMIPIINELLFGLCFEYLRTLKIMYLYTWKKNNLNNFIPLDLGKNSEIEHSQTFCHYNSSIKTRKSIKSNDSEKNEEDFPWNGLISKKMKYWDFCMLNIFVYSLK